MWDSDETDTNLDLTETAEKSTKESSLEDLAAQMPTPEMGAVWDEVHAPGPTSIDGLLLSNAKIVVGRGDFSDSIEAKDFEISNRDSDFHKDIPEWAATGGARTKDTIQDKAGDFQDRLETSRLHTILPSPAMQRNKKSSVEHVSSKAELSIQQEPKPTTHIQHKGEQKGPATKATPSGFVVQADFLLFGKHKVSLSSLQSASQTGAQHYRIALPTELSLGVFMPSLAGSDLDAIALRDTTVTYRSQGTQAGLTLHTTITLSGMLQPVNALLRDVFGQTKPRIDVTTVLSTSRSARECLTRVPQPLGFTMRGELPEVNIPDLFGVLTVTHIGIDVMGSRRGSAGGYDMGYAFFGRGHVGAATQVKWRIDKFGEHWSVSVYTESSSWKNVAGIDGVDVSDAPLLCIRFVLDVIDRD